MSAEIVGSQAETPAAVGCAACRHPDEENDAACMCATAAAGWAWFESVGSPRYWLAPMVGQSEAAFRM
jgi:hypothetical protein